MTRPASLPTGESQRAIRIGQVVEEALRLQEPGRAPAKPAENFVVTRQGGCVGCDTCPCPICGYLFAGEAIVIEHKTRGKRVLSDRGLHYLLHGIVTYNTSYVIHGELVSVTLDLEELASYLDL